AGALCLQGRRSTARSAGGARSLVPSTGGKKKKEKEKSHWAIEMVALRCVEPAAACGLTQGVK
ncbi:hypothetical protein LEMLEM_LOCUS20858, partial [Lemmus lemmus]